MSLNVKWIAIGTTIVAAIVAVVLLVFNPSDFYYEGGFLNLDSGVAAEELPPPMDREPLINALAALSDNFSTRVASTPLPILAELLEDATINIDFTRRDRALLFGGTTSGNATILADGANSNYIIEGNVGLMAFMNLGFNAFVGRESAAIRTSLTGNYFHGITYRTFPQDIRQFAQAISMEQHTMDQLINTVAGLKTALSVGLPDLDVPLIPDARVLVYSLLEYEYEYSTSPNEMIIRIHLSSDDIPVFLSMLDENFAEHLALVLPEHGSISNMVASFDGEPEEARVTFVTRNERLASANLAMYLDATDSYYAFSAGISVCEFSPCGEWRLGGALNRVEGENRSNVWFSDIFWNIYDSSSAMEHTIATTLHEQYNLISFMQIRTIWPHENGHFGLHISDNSSDRTFEGMLYTLEHGGLHLQFDERELNPTTTLSLELEVIPGGSISKDPVPFINLDQWSPTLIETISFVMGLFS